MCPGILEIRGIMLVSSCFNSSGGASEKGVKNLETDFYSAMKVPVVLMFYLAGMSGKDTLHRDKVHIELPQEAKVCFENFQTFF